MKTIIYAHPYLGSLNHSIKEGIENKYEKKNIEYQLIDLYADKFNPVLSSDELYKYSHGKTDDDLVKKYQVMLKKSDELIFVFPTWWYDMPAILKGFFDKVMIPNIMYSTDSDGMMFGKLSNIKNVVVITTAGQTEQYFNSKGINSLNTTFIDQILPDLGISKNSVKRFHYGTIHHTRDNSKKFLQDVIHFV